MCSKHIFDIIKSQLATHFFFFYTARTVPTFEECLLASDQNCNTLQHTATNCNALQHTAANCNALQRTATHCNTLQHTAGPYNTPQRTETYCNILQHTCNTLQHTATHCSTLQHTATHCNTLQNTATHCNTLQYRPIYVHICIHIYTCRWSILTPPTIEVLLLGTLMLSLLPSCQFYYQSLTATL